MKEGKVQVDHTVINHLYLDADRMNVAFTDPVEVRMVVDAICSGDYEEANDAISAIDISETYREERMAK